MSWRDRLQAAQYVSPSGEVFDLTYEDVEVSTDQKATAFEFPDINATFVQHLGHTGRRVPMRVYFNGPDYDLVARAFEQALGESGISELRHPIYGDIQVVPFGSVDRSDGLKSAAGQAVFNLTFYETSELLFPLADEDVRSVIVEVIENGNKLGAILIASAAAVKVVEVQSLFDRITVLIGQARNELAVVYDKAAENQRFFERVFQTISNGLNVGSDLLGLGSALLIMMETPSRASRALGRQASAYVGLANQFMQNIYALGSDGSNTNRFKADDVSAAGCVFGLSLSAINIDFEKRNDAIFLADTLVGLLATYTTWRDLNFESLGVADTGELYGTVVEAVARTAGALVDLSFSLPQEHVLTLESSRCPLELCGELYGSVDDGELDLFLESNLLGGDMLFEIPYGRRVVWYG